MVEKAKVAIVMVAAFSAAVWTAGCRPGSRDFVSSFETKSVVSSESAGAQTGESGATSLSASSTPSGGSSLGRAGSGIESFASVRPPSASNPNTAKIEFYTEKSPNGVTIRRIKDKGLRVVNAADAGMDPKSKDNTDAFSVALAYAAEHPGTLLKIPKGKYYFKPSKSITLKNAKNLIIDGQGSEFVFSTPYHFYVTGCDTVEWRNLIVDWDWDSYRPANLMKVTAKGPDYVDFLLPEVQKINASELIFSTMNQFDPETLTPGAENGKEFHNMSFSSAVNLSDNRIRVYGLTGMASMNVGEVYLQRNYPCKSHCFETAASQNVTYRNIKIYGSSGMGFVFGNGSRHMKLSECVIGLRPGSENVRRISTQADCVHVLNTKGHLWIEGCDFSFSGDDGTNVHENVAQAVSKIDAHTLDVTATMPIAPGDTLEFFSEHYEPLNFKAKVTAAAGTRVRLDQTIPSSVTAGSIIFNRAYDSGKYYIANNYYHENRARGILAQAADGLIENNRFYKNQGASVLIVTDISTGLWSEGTGVRNLTVRGNRFERSNVSNWTAVIEIHTNVNGRTTDYRLMRDIVIENNEFRDFPNLLLNIASAEGVIFRGNSIYNAAPLKTAEPRRGGIRITKSANVRIVDNRWYASPYMSKDVINPEVIGAVSGLTTSGNRWVE